MEMTKANKRRLIFGPILLLVGVVLLIFWKNAPSIIISGLMAAGLASTINGIYSHSKYGVQAESDERTRKISASAATYSWFITLTFVGVLVFLNYFTLLEMTVAKVLGIITKKVMYNENKRYITSPVSRRRIFCPVGYALACIVL